MPVTLYDDNDNPREVPTEEELKASQDKIAELEKSLTAAKEALGKGDDKELNFAKLRTKVTTLETDLKVARETHEKEVGELKSSLSEKEIDGVLTSVVGSGDKELKDKVKFQYNRIKDEAKTPEEIKKKMEDAYVLATGSREGMGFVSSAGAGGGAPQPKGKLNERQESLADDLGLAFRKEKKGAK